MTSTKPVRWMTSSALPRDDNRCNYPARGLILRGWIIGYNQIRMAPEDATHTTFMTPKGLYCYKVMPSGLNTGATYQRSMTVIFGDLLHKDVECYVDDLVVKTTTRQDLLQSLNVVFERLQERQVKMNPLKCAFGVSSKKFLGFVVRYHGIEIDS